MYTDIQIENSISHCPFLVYGGIWYGRFTLQLRLMEIVMGCSGRVFSHTGYERLALIWQCIMLFHGDIRLSIVWQGIMCGWKCPSRKSDMLNGTIRGRDMVVSD